jgi:hypothetical protein
MRRSSVVAVVAVVGLASSCGTPAANSPGPARLTAKDIVQRSSPAIVRINAGAEKVGTGFILDKSGIVATNLHVVLGESAIKISLLDGTQYSVLGIEGVDLDRDLALLRISPAKELPTLKLGDSSAVSAGDQIVAIGNPLGVFDYSVTNGLISQIRHICDQQEIAAKHCKEFTVLQISAAISPGSSGGPLFNQSGEVVGVTTAIVTAGQNLNFAVPANYLKPLFIQHAGMSPDQFAKATRPPDQPGGAIPRQVPHHEVAIWDGCKPEDISDVYQEINEAIENGAPLYNDGKHEACYRIYEGTAVKFEHDGPCAGVRSAFGDGLLRASHLNSYTEKAWAMRDTFDGLLDAAVRWRDQNKGKTGPRAGVKRAKPL